MLLIEELLYKSSAAIAGPAHNMLFTWGYNPAGQLGDGTAVNKSSPIQIGSSSWKQITGGGGNGYKLAITSNGLLYAWGDNSYGQLGDGTLVSKSSPIQIGSSSWSAVSAGSGNNLALRSDGLLFAWGYNNYGQLGNGLSQYQIMSPILVGQEKLTAIGAAASSWIKISSGGRHTMAIRAFSTSTPTSGPLYAWGLNSSGQLGDGTTLNKSSPVQIGALNWSDVSAGASHTVAVLISTGALYTWGDNSTGQLGSSTIVNRSSPVQVGTSSWTAVSASGNRTAGLLVSTGALFTWGDNSVGSLGDGTIVNKSSPVQIGSSSWTIVSGGGTAGIITTGALFTWGDNSNGQLGDGTTNNRSAPFQIGTSSWTTISASSNHTAGILTTGALYTWGFNGGGQLGDGTTSGKSSPVHIGTSSWSVVNAGTNIQGTAGILSTGALFTWGFGYLGDGTNIGKSSPVQIGSSSWLAVSSNGTDFFAIRSSDRTLWGWGDNLNGYVGNLNGLVAVSSVTSISTLSWTKIAAGPLHTAAIKSDGSMWTWGDNSTGQLGDGTVISRSSPVQIGTSSWIAVSTTGSIPVTTGYFTLGILSTGALYAWGFNVNGNLGDNTIVNKSSPVHIGASSWSAIATGAFHSLGITTTGALFTWGYNFYGQLGDATAVGGIGGRSSPVQIGTSSWSVVSAAIYMSAGILTTGALFTWGQNGSGILGDGTTINRSSPVQIGTSSWSAVSVGSNCMAGILTIGALYTWGNNGSGQLGDNTIVNKSSPVHIGASSWSAVSVGYGCVAGILTTGALYSWGTNIRFNSAGDSTNTNPRSSPVQVGTSSWAAVSVGQDHTTIALQATTGNMYGWGDNTNGQLGIYNADPTFNNSQSSPIQIGSSSWTIISAGGYHSAGILTTGALYTWGWNATGQLGDGTIVNKSSPVLIGTSSWAVVSAGYGGAFGDTTSGILTTGALYTWGDNFFGELGDGTLVNRSSPVQIGTSSWTVVSVGPNHTAAILTTGALYTWGDNFNGGLGDNTTASKSSPVHIGSSSWIMVSAGGGFETDGDNAVTAAININKLLYTWGNNLSGQVGDGTTVTRSSPVQIGTSSWSAVYVGGYGGAAITV